MMKMMTTMMVRMIMTMPMMISLYLDEFGWPEPACRFPLWLNVGQTWRDVDDEKRLFSVDDERGNVFTEYFLGVRKSGGRGSNTPASSFSSVVSRTRQLLREDRCLQRLNETTEGEDPRRRKGATAVREWARSGASLHKDGESFTTHTLVIDNSLV